MTSPARPVLRYHGGKWRAAPWIIDLLPPHRTYVEPYGGGASVLMRKARSDFEVYNDLDGNVVNVFRVLRDSAMALELEKQLRLTPWARVEFDLAYEETDDAVERARRMIVRCFMGHGTTSVRKHRTGFRAGSHPGRKGGGFGDWSGYHDALQSFTARLQGVVLENRQAIEVMQRHDKPDAVFYVDPPYVLETRSSIRGRGEAGSRAYRHELTDDDHRELGAFLHSVQAAVIVSGYACTMYDEDLYAGWERHERQARGDGAVARTEVLWIKPAGPIPFAGASHHQTTMGL